ncbi:MAG: hypothetical protein K2Z81_00730 [Cyanobacteria bacterium]|nr:hypothetical protein [Cyanobacteriota bacterium]
MTKFMEEVQNCGCYGYKAKLGKTLRRYGWTKAQIRMVCKRIDEINHDEDDYENADNLRIARKSNEKEVDEYNEVAETGCCGVYDEELEVEAGGNNKEVVLFGFNYGH